MDPQDIRTLKLLEAIEAEPGPSQRDLATQLNVSLGLVNSFVKRLTRKGYFKVSTIPANRMRYILTPKGAAEKTRLTYEYIQYSIVYYRETRLKMVALFGRLKARELHRCVFWGVSELTEIAYISLQEAQLTLAAVIDRERAGERFLGFRVHDPSDLGRFSYDRILITSVGDDVAAAREIAATGAPAEAVIRLSEVSGGAPR